MNKLLLCITLFISVISSAQSLFDKLEDSNDITTVVVTKEMFDLLRKFPDAISEDMEVFNTISGLNELKIFSSNKINITQEMKGLIQSSIKEKNLVQLIRIKDGATTSIKIYVKTTEKEGVVSEVLMLVNNHNDSDDNSVIISLTGNIDVNKLANIAKKLSSK